MGTLEKSSDEIDSADISSGLPGGRIVTKLETLETVWISEESSMEDLAAETLTL
jgi:hypothetical protein